MFFNNSVVLPLRKR